MSQCRTGESRINVYYPFIDHVIEQLETKFNDEHQEIIAAEYLLPQNLHKLCDDKIAMILSYYGKFMSAEEKTNLSIEIAKWTLQSHLKIGQIQLPGLYQSTLNNHSQH